VRSPLWRLDILSLPMTQAPPLDAFLAKWNGSEGSERSHSQHFLIDLCDLIGLARPGTKPTDDFRFEKDADFQGPDRVHHGRADLVRRGAFVLESKQFTNKERATKAWNLGMQEALGQALGYAKTLEDAPVFVIACDVGHCFELLACFDGSGHWRPFPASTNRIYLPELKDSSKFAQLAAALKDPHSLNPALRQLEITTDVAAKIADLARALRTAGHDREIVARFLMRCLFTMFAEDVGLFEGKKKIFEHYLRDYWIKSPVSFPNGVSVLWQTMNTGGSLMTGEKVHKFNGGLFRDHSALPMTKEQLEVLLQAAERDWSQVEPAIFGTLLENALGEKERHALGAHFTPRAYVERLVRPTIEEPLRAEWLVVRAQVRSLLGDGTGKTDEKAALAALKAFHARLCKIRVLDPACGTGNFLYVAMDLLKQLEEEVLEQIRRVGGSGQELLELDTITVSPKSFLGIEKNPWAKEIAELVLWIGYLRWQWRLRGTTAIAQSGESILRDEKNIECRDAVLDWDGAPVEKVKLDSKGRPVTRWDGATVRNNPITGQEMPDDRAQVPDYQYPNPRRPLWPEADFIIGNPPFLGTRRMRLGLGDGYVEALAKAWPDVADNCDFVMYWWSYAAEKVRTGKARAFGLITTKTIVQSFNRSAVRTQMEAKPPLGIAFAIPNHPWVDWEDGAQVRVAVTVGHPGPVSAGRLFTVARESDGAEGLPAVVLSPARVGEISDDLRVGATTTSARPLKSNQGIAYWGVKFYGDGFQITREQHSGLIGTGPTLARRFVSGKDLTGRWREALVIDCDGLDENQLRERFPPLYQWLLERVKPVRAHNPRAFKRERWWIFGENQPGMRRAVADVPWYIVTTETAKHRVFHTMEKDVLTEGGVCVIALPEHFSLGVLSSRCHVVWALAAGGRLGVGNDPRYNKTVCLDPYPFPAATPAQRSKIGDLAKQIDSHRKRQLAAHAKLTVTALYNVLESLRAGVALNEKEKIINEHGLVSVLRQLHDELDLAVFDAYGWDKALSDEALLEKLVALNAERAAEELRGEIRYLRPDFQAPKTQVVTQPTLAIDTEPDERPSTLPPAPVAATRAWPKTYFERASAVRDLVQSLPEGAHFGAGTLETHFRGKSNSRAGDIATILETFAALGQFVTLAPGYYGRPVRRAG
jgi:hypothetical protein